MLQCYVTWPASVGQAACLLFGINTCALQVHNDLKTKNILLSDSYEAAKIGAPQCCLCAFVSQMTPKRSIKHLCEHCKGTCLLRTLQ